MRRLPALALATLCLSPATAQAAWKTEVVPSVRPLTITSLGFQQGHGLLLYEGFDTRPFTGVARRDAAAASWSAAGRLEGIGWGNAQVDFFGARGALLSAHRPYGRERGRARWETVTAFGRRDGRFGPLITIDRDAANPQVAVNARGRAVLAWTRSHDAAVRVAFRAPRGGFGRPTTRTPEGAFDHQVAINDRGDVLLAWAQGRRIQARFKRAGRAWGRPVTVARAGLPVSNVRIALSPGGRALVTYGAVFVGEATPNVVEHGLAYRHRGWRATRLDSFTRRTWNGEAHVIPRFDVRGRALAAWVGLDDAQQPALKLARVTSSRYTVLARIPALEAPIAGFETSPLGALAVTWYGPDTNAGPFATVASDGVNFEAPKDLHEARTASLASVLAFQGERPVVAWVVGVPPSGAGLRVALHVP